MPSHQICECMDDCQKAMYGLLFPPLALTFLVFGIRKALGPQLYKYVENSDYVEALQYVKNSPVAASEEAFTTVWGYNAIHLIFQEDLGKADLLPLLDEIIAHRPQEFMAMNPFDYTLSKEQFHLHFAHLVTRHGNLLTDNRCLNLVKQMVQLQVENQVFGPMLNHLQQMQKLPLLLDGGEDSAFLKAATSNARIFTLFCNTISSRAVSDQVYSSLLLHMAKREVSEEAHNKVMAMVREAGKTALIVAGNENSPLVQVVRSGSTTLFRLYMREVNCSDLRLDKERTLLHEMARYGRGDCLKVMWNEKRQEVSDLIDYRDDEHRTAIFEAASRNHDGVVETLISYGADYTLKGMEGQSPLTPHEVAPSQPYSRSRQLLRAAEEGFFASDLEFSKRGEALIDKRKAEGLLVCCDRGDARAALELVKIHNVNPNYTLDSDFTQDAPNDTPLLLLLASRQSQERGIVSFLREVGSRINVFHRNSKGKTACDLAKARGFHQVVAYLNKLVAQSHLPASSPTQSPSPQNSHNPSPPLASTAAAAAGCSAVPGE